MGGSKPQPPEAPDVGKSTADSIQAYIENYPELVDLMGQYQPQLDAMAANSARTQAYAQHDITAESMSKYGDDIMDEVMNLEGKYGGALAKQYVDNMRQASPGYFNVRDQYEQRLQDDLALGNTLSDDQTRLVQQSARAGQQARGNLRGTAPSAEEMMKTFLAGEGLADKRMGRAYQYAATPAPGVSVGTTPSVMQAYRGQPMPNYSSGQVNPNQGMAFGQWGAGMAQKQYGQQMGIYQDQMANSSSPLGGAIGGGLSGASTGSMFGPWGAAIGGGIGAIGGYASSSY